MRSSVLDPRIIPKRLSPASRTLLHLLGSSTPQVGPAGHAAKRLGLSSRFGLARLLKREGIPPLHRLSGWFDVLRWVRAGEQDAVSLCRVAFVSHRDPAACYRLVKRVTGRPWSEVRTLGSDWVTARISALLHGGDVPRGN
ncbi:MAG: hypothetical protein Q8Q14_03015 [Gemmatimonadales bacterium]|nr:hypothetical protein [Gemmatimonadales bacterium]